MVNLKRSDRFNCFNASEESLLKEVPIKETSVLILKDFLFTFLYLIIYVMFVSFAKIRQILVSQKQLFDDLLHGKQVARIFFLFSHSDFH